MNTDPLDLAGRAEALRHAFDRSFATAHAVATQARDDLLAIRLGDDRYAIRVDGIGGLFADRQVTPLPGPLSELLGIAGLRGALIPVYDLRLLLGYPGGGTPRWLVLATAGAPLGLAFDHLEGHLHLPRSAITVAARPDAAARHVREVAQTADGARPIVNLPSLLAAITRRADPAMPSSRRDEP
jgi:purine-binding chemotaxis protein CheW